MSSRAVTRPAGLVVHTSAPRPPSFSLERGPTRSPRADGRSGGGAGTHRTGRRGEGVPVWNGPFSAPHCTAGRDSPLMVGGCILGCGDTRGYEERRLVEAAPRGSPQQRVCGVPAAPAALAPWGLRRRKPLPAGAEAEPAHLSPPREFRGSLGPADLGCPKGWARDPPPDPRLLQPPPNKFRALLRSSRLA